MLMGLGSSYEASVSLPEEFGLVEGTLCLGLVAAGVHVALALASVLLYRFVSFWIVTGAGWVVLLFLRRDRDIDAAIFANRTPNEATVSGGLR